MELQNSTYNIFTVVDGESAGEAEGFATSSPVQPSEGQSQPPQRCKGRTGGKWDDAATRAFLEACKPVRQMLRVRVPKPEAWQAVAASLSSSYDYSGGQCAEKMRNLKRTFKDAKGKQRGTLWPYFKDMVFIFDSPLPGEFPLE